MTATELKNKLLNEAADFDVAEYREDIRTLADKYGPKYDTNFFGGEKFGTSQKNSKKHIYIALAVVLVLAGVGGGVYYFKKVKK